MPSNPGNVTPEPTFAVNRTSLVALQNDLELLIWNYESLTSPSLTAGKVQSVALFPALRPKSRDSAALNAMKSKE